MLNQNLSGTLKKNTQHPYLLDQTYLTDWVPFWSQLNLLRRVQQCWVCRWWWTAALRPLQPSWHNCDASPYVDGQNGERTDLLFLTKTQSKFGLNVTKKSILLRFTNNLDFSLNDFIFLYRVSWVNQLWICVGLLSCFRTEFQIVPHYHPSQWSQTCCHLLTKLLMPTKQSGVADLSDR